MKRLLLLILPMATVLYADERHFTMTDGLVSNTVRSIMQDSIGYLWFGTTNGFSRYDGYTFVSYADSVAYKGHYLQQTIAYTSDGTQWEAIYGEGLHVTNPDLGLDRHVVAGDHSPLISNNIKAIYADRSGSVWIGYEFYGLTQIRPDYDLGFQYQPLSSPDDAEGNFVRMVSKIGDQIWVGNRDNTLFRADADGMFHEYSKLPSHPYCVLSEDDYLLIGTREGGLITLKDKQISSDVHQEEQEQSLADDHIYDMYRDHEGRIWVGTFGGGLDLRQSFGQYLHFLQGDTDTRHVRDIAEDAQGRIWVSTGAGLYMFRPEALMTDSNAYIRYNQSNGTLPGNQTRTLYINNEQKLFVSIVGQGFVTADLTTDSIRFEQWKPLAGMGALPIVQTFVEDRSGKIWVGTEYGIARFDPADGSFRNFYPSRELGGNVIEEQTGIRLDDGRIMMGTHQGVMTFDPSMLNYQEDKPIVHLTDLAVSEGNVRMSFSTFDYADVYPDRYRFRLQGYEKQWSTPTVINVVEYKHLQPGTYHLEVQSISESGVEGDIYQFAFEIDCPWYRTWWAYLSYLILLGGIAYYIIHTEQDKYRLRKRLMLDDQVKKQEPEATVLNREDQEYRQRLDQVIEEELANGDFSVEDFAARMNLGRTVFFRRTKEVTGYSPKEYLRLTRMNRAAQLLVNSDKNVSEVAYSVGMSDPLYFSKCFKQQFGVAPSRYGKN